MAEYQDRTIHEIIQVRYKRASKGQRVPYDFAHWQIQVRGYHEEWMQGIAFHDQAGNEVKVCDVDEYPHDIGLLSIDLPTDWAGLQLTTLGTGVGEHDNLSASAFQSDFEHIGYYDVIDKAVNHPPLSRRADYSGGLSGN